MDIKVNGETMALPEGQNQLLDVLQQLGIPQDQPGIAIAINLELVPRSEWPMTSISEHSEIEVITARQGG